MPPPDYLREKVNWQFVRLQRWVNGWLVRFGPAWRIRCRWPWPVLKPWQRRRFRAVSDGKGIGDELMCMPVFREIKRLRPQCHITFVSRHPELFRAYPYLDIVEPFDEKRGKNGCYILTYGPVFPPPRPLVALLGECLGLRVSGNELDPPALNPSPAARAEIDALPKPRIVIQPVASVWTPNKNWPLELWAELIRLLVTEFEVIEAGTQPMFTSHEFGPRFHSLAGRTNLAAFGYLISQATVFVGPVSGGLHLASAFRIPSVIIYGGYEHPADLGYVRMTAFYSAVGCAPCWLRTPCPYDITCLRMIQPAEVFSAIRAQAASIAQT